MEYTDEYGLVAPELGFVPSPAYLMLRSALIDLMAEARPGRFLEIGCGSGALSCDLARLGLSGAAFDESPAMRELAARLLADVQGVSVVAGVKRGETFDYVVSADQLAKEQDEAQALRLWAQLLRPGGLLLAGLRATTRDGSSRRRRDAAALFRLSGLRIRRVVTWGVPLPTPLASAWRLSPESWRAPDPSPDPRRLKSYPLYGNLLSRLAVSLFMYGQGRFRERERGAGYLILADRLEP